MRIRYQLKAPAIGPAAAAEGPLLPLPIVALIGWVAVGLAAIGSPRGLRGEVTATVVLDGLRGPCGVAVQPETGTVFVSESAASRVIRVVDGKPQPVIVGFPQDEYGKGPKYTIGPLGLNFLDKQRLVVGGGGLPDGEEQVRVYQLPDPGADPLQVDAAEHRFQLAADDKAKGEGNFHGVVTTKFGLFVTCNGDDDKGWVAKAEVSGTKIAPLRRFIPTRELTGVSAPAGITVSPEGHLVVAQMGPIADQKDGVLAFYHPNHGGLLARFTTQLHDMTAVAYRPGDNPQLYALDFSWADPGQGGLFQLIAQLGADKPAVRSLKILALDKPTAMAFDAEGNLYLTLLGTGAADGKLIKVSGL